MPIYAIDKHERFRHYPDPDDEQTWVDYRRATVEKEVEIDAACTRNGQLDRVKKLNMMCAWGVVDWAGYGEPDGTPIPYDFRAEYEEETPGEQDRKMRIVGRMPRFLKADIMGLMQATLVRREADLKNSRNGSPAAGALGAGSQGAMSGASGGFPSRVPTAERPA